MDYIQAEKLLKKAKSIALFTHIRPDGDALGSTLALRYFLEKSGKRADVFCDSPIPEKFLILDRIGDFRAETEEFIAESYELAVSVDCASIERLGGFARIFSKFKTNTLSIDHHTSNTRFAAVNLISDDASCAETVFKLIKRMGGKPDKTLASYLMTGIITDTGSFLQSNTRPETFAAAAELTATGVDFSVLGIAVFRMQSLKKFNLERRALGSLKFFEDGRIAAIRVSLADLSETGTDTADTEGFINSALYIEGVEAAIAITETLKSGFKISMRSRGDIDVNSACGTFGGGGHKNAAGCVLHGAYEEVLEKCVRALSLELK